jgi:hypothetical protein
MEKSLCDCEIRNSMTAPPPARKKEYVHNCHNSYASHLRSDHVLIKRWLDSRLALSAISGPAIANASFKGSRWLFKYDELVNRLHFVKLAGRRIAAISLVRL